MLPSQKMLSGQIFFIRWPYQSVFTSRYMFMLSTYFLCKEYLLSHVFLFVFYLYQLRLRRPWRCSFIILKPHFCIVVHRPEFADFSYQVPFINHTCYAHSNVSRSANIWSPSLSSCCHNFMCFRKYLLTFVSTHIFWYSVWVISIVQWFILYSFLCHSRVSNFLVSFVKNFWFQ